MSAIGGRPRRDRAAPQSQFLHACLAAEPSHWRAPRRATFGGTVAEASGLAIARKRRRLAGPVTLGFREGQITALLGASGVAD